jgi:HK97 family phage major capsid protein
MTPEELKAIVSDEVKTLKEGLQHFVKTEDMQKEIANLQKSIEDNNVKGLETQMSELQKAAEAQGIELKKIQSEGAKRNKTFHETLTDRVKDLETLSQDQRAKSVIIPTTRKAVVNGSVSGDTLAYRESGVSEIQRGKPWLRDLFNVVTLGSNSHGDVKWYEQLAQTNNAAAVSEGPGAGAYPAAASDLTWIERSIGGKRLKDYIKVSKDQLKDVDFINGEVRTFIDKNMRLAENTALLSGDGNGNNVKGINTYAPAFDTTGLSVDRANMIDLLQVMKTQIRVNSLDAFIANNAILNPEDADVMRLLKNTNGSYLFPQWAIGGMPSLAGLGMVENSLVTADTLLMGDFSYGTIYEWDGLLIEIGYIDKDFLEGMVTIMAYERINLRVKETEKGAFLKVASIASDVSDITAPTE